MRRSIAPGAGAGPSRRRPHPLALHLRMGPIAADRRACCPVEQHLALLLAGPDQQCELDAHGMRSVTARLTAALYGVEGRSQRWLAEPIHTRPERRNIKRRTA